MRQPLLKWLGQINKDHIQSSMRQFFISFVCHCEKIWWDKGYNSLITGINAFLAMQHEVSQKLNYSVSSTFCTLIDHPNKESRVADISNVPDLFRQIISDGNEIGLHIHGPIQEMKTDFQDCLIHSDTQYLNNNWGIKPTTYAAGDWITSKKTIPALESAGFKVDCSVYNLEPLEDKFGVERNYAKRKNLRPYYPDYGDICQNGNSKIVELPVSGNLSEFVYEIYLNLPSITERIHKRYQELDNIDIFQIFWHPFEIVTLNDKTNDELIKQRVKLDSGKDKIGINSQILDRAKDFLIRFGQNSNVKIASAIEAAEVFRKSKPRQD